MDPRSSANSKQNTKKMKSRHIRVKMLNTEDVESYKQTDQRDVTHSGEQY